MATAISDDSFWTDPFRDPPPGAPQSTSAIAVLAPDVVAIRTRDTFPVVARYTQTLRDRMLVDFRELGVVVAVDVDSNELFTGMAMDRDGLEPREVDPEDLKDVIAATTVSPYLIELRAQAEVPWRFGEYLVTVMVRDVFSNRVRVRLGNDSSAYDDPEVARFLAEQRGVRGAAGASPPAGDPYPNYGPDPRSPKIPSADGLALSLQGRILHGAFRLPTMREDLAGGRAFVGIHLVLVGDDDALPIPLSLQVPSADPIDPQNPPASITGHFALDLDMHVRFGRRAQSWSLYAFSRAFMAGPLRAR